MKQHEQQNQFTRGHAVSSLILGLRLLGKVGKLELDTVVFSGRKKITPTTKPRLNWIAILIQSTKVYCTKVYCITMSAIAKNGAAPRFLSIYRETGRCSVLLHELGSHTATLDSENPELKEVGPSIQELAISVSTFTRYRSHESKTTRFPPGRYRDSLFLS